MTDTSSEITNPKFRVWMRPDGIVHEIWEPNVAASVVAQSKWDVFAHHARAERQDHWVRGSHP